MYKFKNDLSFQIFLIYNYFIFSNKILNLKKIKKHKSMNMIKNKFEFFNLNLGNKYLNYKINCSFFLLFYKYQFTLFIIFTLPILIIKIIIMYFLMIIILLLFVNIFNFSLDNLFSYFIDLFCLNSNNLGQEFTNMESNISNASLNNSEPNLPNTPNPIGSESAVVISQGSTQDNIQNNEQSSLLDIELNEEESIIGNNIQTTNNEIPESTNSEDIVGFDEIEYDPQFDDIEFNPCVLYHKNHPFFVDMVYNHLSNNNIIDLVETITSTSRPEWDLEAKQDALSVIEYIVYRRLN